MDRYVFTESRRYIEVVITIAVVAFVVYSARRSMTVAVLVGLVFLLFSCTTIKEFLFIEKALIITNVYGIKSNIQYNEIKYFGTGIRNNVLFVIALKKKFIPLFFASRGELRKQMPEILARLESVTGRKADTINIFKKKDRA